MRRLGLLILTVSLFAVPATANAATAGGLKQLAGIAGCVADDAGAPPSDCADARGMGGISDVVMSPGGSTVYVSSVDKDAIAIFNRNPTTGALTQKSGVTGCVTSNATFAAAPDSCNLLGTTVPLTDVNAMAMSPDGKSLYTVNAAGKASVFNRASDGTLTYLDTDGCCNDVSATSVVVSPDGKNVYAAGPYFSSIVVQFTRDTAAGANFGNIDFATCYGNGGGCNATGVSNFTSPNSLAITPDGKELMITAANSVLLGWNRNATNGNLTPTTAADHCISASDLGGTCQARQGINATLNTSVLDNDRFFMLSQYSLISVARNATSGAITPDTSGNCLAYPQSTFAGCTPFPGTCCSAYYPTRDVVQTADKKNLYIGTESPSPAVWGVNRAGGSIAVKPAPLRCLSAPATDPCGTFRQGNRVQTMAASPDSRYVYAGGNNRIFAFQVDRPPVCQNVSAGTVNTTSVRVSFNCSDPDGDALTYEKVTDPSRGTLAGVSGNGVNYGPQPGTTGVDSFTYRARGAGVASDPATASINVSAPPAPPGGGGGGTTPPPPPQLIPSTVTNNWLAFPAGYTKVTQLSVNNLLAATTVRVTCKVKGKSKKKQKKGCPYSSKRFTTSGARAKLNLLKPFRKKKIPRGTKITITVTVPGQIGKRFQYTMRKGKIPKKSLRCISPGGKISTCS